MPSLTSCVTLTEMSARSIQINKETREVRLVPIMYAAAKKGHGPNCKCEPCAAMYMQRTKDKRLKAMVPGNVDMGNRQPAVMGKKKKAKANSALMMNKQVPPPTQKVDKIKPSNLMHEKGKILK